MRKIKEIIFSENGMKAVNTLFFLSMLFYRSGLLFVAYIVWICYLVYCIKNTESRGNKVIYSLFAGLAVVMIGVNLYGLMIPLYHPTYKNHWVTGYGYSDNFAVVNDGWGRNGIYINLSYGACLVYIGNV